MKKPEYISCLRPLNTALLVKDLREGKSINLVGHPKAGRERMLDDIQECMTTVKHIRLNMKNYVGSYDALLESIADQMGINYNDKTSLGELVGAISRESVKCFILIDNFDAILDNTELDKKYTRSFFDTLNSLKNKSNISLLCATTKPHENSLIYIGGVDNGTSWLQLERELLQNLNYENIEVELDRQLKDSDLWKNIDTDRKSMYVNEIYSERHNYDFLCYFTKRFKLQSTKDIKASVSEKIKCWRKEFKQLQPQQSTVKKLRGIRKYLHQLSIVLRIKDIVKWVPLRSVMDFILEFRNKKK